MNEPGGFLQPVLPSPPNSSVASHADPTPELPQPRHSPLKPGSAKESTFIDFVDRRLLAISRRYEKRFNIGIEDDAIPDPEGKGYESFAEVAKDLELVQDVIWVSGTRTIISEIGRICADLDIPASLQTPYFLTIALTIVNCLPSFSFAPLPTFHSLHKLDLAFSSLLQGLNVESGELLPGFEGGRGKLSTTEKVRMKGLVERTRTTVVEVAGRGNSGTEAESMARSHDNTEDDLMTDDDDTMDDLEVNGNHGRWEMEISRVYEKTIVELGLALDVSGLGGFLRIRG